VLLDRSGVGRFQFNIFNFGDYEVDVDVSGQMASGMVSVGPSQSTCP
jgi:hypothetical protein